MMKVISECALHFSSRANSLVTNTQHVITTTLLEAKPLPTAARPLLILLHNPFDYHRNTMLPLNISRRYFSKTLRPATHTDKINASTLKIIKSSRFYYRTRGEDALHFQWVAGWLFYIMRVSGVGRSEHMLWETNRRINNSNTQYIDA